MLKKKFKKTENISINISKPSYLGRVEINLMEFIINKNDYIINLNYKYYIMFLYNIYD
jgi:hypothetical protein